MSNQKRIAGLGWVRPLRVAHAWPVVIAAFIGRLPLGMIPLAMLLFVLGITHSYPMSGLVLAAYTIANALWGPGFKGALWTRMGPGQSSPGSPVPTWLVWFFSR